MKRLILLAVAALCFRVHAADPASPPPIPPAPGPHTNLTERDFAEARSHSATNRLVGTYYFYWYNADTKEHLVNGDGTDALTDHPATLDGFSYASAAWHRKELLDMMEAGIDVVLPVFWGAPSDQGTREHPTWSYAGLAKLVEAREALVREGREPPRIGMFYDTSTLQFNAWGVHVCLTNDYGRRWFYATVRDFFSLVPPRHWAMIDGRPIVVLYAAAFARGYDAAFLDYTGREFAREFGGRVPWIAAEVSWNVPADARVAWGGALGLKRYEVAALGPGYDHSAVRGRTPLVAPREDGRFYERNWARFLRRPTNLVLLETWNEYHEGTDIAESREYGRRYIELTRKHVDLFKQGATAPQPQGRFTGAASVAITLGATNEERGLRWVDHADGRTAPTESGGRPARAVRPVAGQGRYVYFAVDDSFKSGDDANLVLEVEYFDASPGALAVEFDGSDPAAPFDGAYSQCSDVVALTASKTWKTARFDLKAARFENRQNNGADLRLAVTASDFAVGGVTLRRR